VRYRILGPLEVLDGERSIPLGTAKQQALLAVLVLYANEFVARERLIDELWGESPPATAAKAVQVYVSQLRKLLTHNGEQAIATRPRGYILSLDGESVDALSFERIAREARERAASGDAEQAAFLFREGLELWRGPALAGLIFESVARNEVERLEEERLAALMDRIDCDLSLGRHEQLVGELEGMVAQHPLQERFRSQLMLALYRSGRQADALRVYREGRETLVEQLGLEPSEPLQRLERAILVHDPVLEAPAGRLARPRVPTAVETAALPANRRRRLPRALVAAATLVLAAAIAVAITVFLRAEEPAAKLLQPNSVGFIDAGSGRVTRSFPVGRLPVAIAVARDSVWVANQQDETVSRLDRRTGSVLATIPVRAHPTGIAVHKNRVWVWTVEGKLIPIDPRFDVAGEAVDLPAPGPDPEFIGGDRPARGREAGKITAAGGFLWLTAPGTTVIRVRPETPERHRSFVPSDGAQGAAVALKGNLWVAGYSQVFPIAARSGIEGTGITVGLVRDLAYGAGSLWVVSGSETGAQGVRTALRRVDVRGRVIRTTIAPGTNPVAVEVAGHSVWLASAETIQRVDPENDQIIDAIPVGATLTDMAGDVDGIWVAVK
jgi:YVTN family beta-propeller protein